MPGFPASNSEGSRSSRTSIRTRPSNCWPTLAIRMVRASPRSRCGCVTRRLSVCRQRRRLPPQSSRTLASTVEVSNQENKTFTDAMNAKPTQIQFGMVSYGMDFLDPFNMLGVWLSTGRHNWAPPSSTSWSRCRCLHRRSGRAHQDVPGCREDAGRTGRRCLPLHRTPGDLYRPYLKGTNWSRTTTALQPALAGLLDL